MKNLTIRQKLFLGFLFIIVLSASIFFVTHHSLTELKSLSSEVVPITKQINNIYSQIEVGEKLESDIEVFILIRSEDSKDQLNSVITEMTEDIKNFELNYGEEEVNFLVKSNTIQQDINNLIDTLDTEVNPNRQMAKIYTSIENLRYAQKDLLNKKTVEMQENIQKQHNIINKLIVKLVVIEIAIIVFGIIIAWVLSEAIISALIKLEDFADLLSKGKKGAKVHINTKDEIGELSNAFNKMADNIEIYQQRLLESEKQKEKELQEQVKARTNELENKNKELEKFNKLTIGREQKMIEMKKEIKELKSKLKGG